VTETPMDQDSTANLVTPENLSTAALEANSTCPASDLGSTSPSEGNEDDMDDDTHSQRSNGSDLQNSYAASLIRIGFNPLLPSFNDRIREAREFNEKLKDDNFNIDDTVTSPTPLPSRGPPEDPPPDSPPIEDAPNPGSEPDDNEPEPEMGSDSSPPSSPTPDRTFQYKFYDNEGIYWGPSIRTGDQTAVDRLTSYRRFGEGPWKPVPNGFVVPRLDNADEHERDATHIEEQLTAAAEERRISRERAKQAAIEEGEREKAEFAAKEKAESADRKVASMKPKLRKIPHEEDYQTPSESDGSGSDYSATAKANSKKRPPPSSSSDESDIDATSETPKLASRPKKQVKLQAVTPALSDGNSGRTSSATPTGRTHSTTPKSGRPAAKQLEYCRNLRARIDTEIKKAAQMFNAKEETILRQVGLGGASIVQENNLYNLFKSARKREQKDASRTGMCLFVPSIQ